MENFEIKLAGSDISSWQAKLPDLRLTLKQLLSRPLPYGLFRNIHCTDEEISSDLENPDTTQIGLQKLAVREVDGQKKSLTELCDKFKAALYLILPEHLITLDEIKQVITRVASRVCYGVYDKNVVINEDTNPLGMYIWEAQDNPQSNEIKQKRKMTKKMICSLYKLINAIDRAVPNEINIQNLYDAYSKAFKSYDGFEKEQNEKKRKREQAEQEKAEKRAKVEEDKRAKAQRLEEEKRLAREKKEEEKRAKEAQRMEEKQKREAERAAQQPRLKMPQPVAEPVKPSGPRISTFFAPKTGPIVTESQIARANEKFMRTPDIGAGLSGWIEVFRAHQRPLRDSRNLQYILIEESDKKPYYCGMHQPQYSVGRLCTAPFAALQEVDYEKDSEEEMLEMDAESLSASSSGDTDEEDSLSEGEKQWIVADGYFSDGEVSDTELQAKWEMQAKTDSEFRKPIAITIETDPQNFLSQFAAVSLSDVAFPIIITIPEAKKIAKANIEDYVEELEQIIQDNSSKQSIIKEFKSRHPDISKKAIESKMSFLIVKTTRVDKKKQFVTKSQATLPYTQTALPVDESAQPVQPTTHQIFAVEKPGLTLEPTTGRITPCEQTGKIDPVTTIKQEVKETEVREEVKIMTVIPRRIEPKSLPVDATTPSVPTN